MQKLNGINILVVDDEPDNLGVVQKLLQYLGATVTVADNGKEGLAAALESTPHLIITDLSMPVMSGWDLLREARTYDNLNDVPVIALTAHAMAGDKERVLQAGFANYISKPIKVEQFIPDIVRMLRAIPSLSELMKE